MSRIISPNATAAIGVASHNLNQEADRRHQEQQAAQMKLFQQQEREKDRKDRAAAQEQAQGYDVENQERQHEFLAGQAVEQKFENAEQRNHESQMRENDMEFRRRELKDAEVRALKRRKMEIDALDGVLDPGSAAAAEQEQIMLESDLAATQLAQQAARERRSVFESGVADAAGSVLTANSEIVTRLSESMQDYFEGVGTDMATAQPQTRAGKTWKALTAKGLLKNNAKAITSGKGAVLDEAELEGLDTAGLEHAAIPGAFMQPRVVVKSAADAAYLVAQGVVGDIASNLMGVDSVQSAALSKVAKSAMRASQISRRNGNGLTGDERVAAHEAAVKSFTASLGEAKAAGLSDMEVGVFLRQLGAQGDSLIEAGRVGSSSEEFGADAQVRAEIGRALKQAAQIGNGRVKMTDPKVIEMTLGKLLAMEKGVPVEQAVREIRRKYGGVVPEKVIREATTGLMDAKRTSRLVEGEEDELDEQIKTLSGRKRSSDVKVDNTSRSEKRVYGKKISAGYGQMIEELER